VAGQGIGRIRIEPIRHAIEQLNQPAFQRIIGMEVAGDERRLPGMKYGATAHSISTGGDRFAIALDPVWRHHGIGVRRQENTIRPNPLFRESHCHPTRLPSMSVPHWEVMAFHMQSVGQRRCHSGGNRRRSVTAIVGEYQHGVRTT
jgi:hypothetical protein